MKLKQIVGKPEAVAADSAYKTPTITSYLFDKEIVPALPYTLPRTKEGFFRKHEYVYDEHFDCYPSGEILKTNKEGYCEYESPKHICATCSFYPSAQKAKTIKKW